MRGHGEIAARAIQSSASGDLSRGRSFHVYYRETQFTTRRGIVRAVNGVCLEINESEVLGLVGESGSGKSVTARSILRLVPPSRQSRTRIGRI